MPVESSCQSLFETAGLKVEEFRFILVMNSRGKKPEKAHRTPAMAPAEFLLTRKFHAGAQAGQAARQSHTPSFNYSRLHPLDQWKSTSKHRAATVRTG